MDWHPIPFEPNLKFTLELKGDLKTKYLEQHEKAKRALESFSFSLQSIYHEHQSKCIQQALLFKAFFSFIPVTQFVRFLQEK